MTRAAAAVGVAAALGAAACWRSATPDAPARDLAVSLAVDAALLGNGMRLIVVPQPKATTVSVSVRYAVGAVDDPPGREGLAHLVEHLSYQTRADGKALYDRMSAAAVGVNGTTFATHTVYRARGAPDQLGALLGFEAERLRDTCRDLPDAVFAREREVVRNELRERSHRALVDVEMRALFPAGHPLARADADTTDTVATIDRGTACAFFAAHYAPARAVLVIDGPVSLADARAAAERAFAAAPEAAAPPTTAAPEAATPDAAAPDAAAPAPPPAPTTSAAPRALAPATAIPPVTSGGAADAEIPGARDHLLVAWPLPADPSDRAQLRVLIDMLAGLCDADIDGDTAPFELGDAVHVGYVGVDIVPSAEVSLADARAGVDRAFRDLHDAFSAGYYEQQRAHAMFELLSAYADPASRAEALVDALDAGRDPAHELDARFAAMRALTRDGAASLADRALRLGDARVVRLHARKDAPAAAVAAAAEALAAPSRDDLASEPIGDPAEARAPLPPIASPDPIADDDPLTAVRTFTLPNGLSVVLLPMSGVPVVDIRLRFAAGAADEPPARRGLATLAARIQARSTDRIEMLAFWLAGGAIDHQVALDGTRFRTTGLAIDLDHLLIGLDRTIEFGGTADLGSSARWLRRYPSAPFEQTWETALFGAHHPYTGAGTFSPGAFDDAAIRAFRDGHYTPDRATLIVAGGFDPQTARAWIESAFGAWTGHAVREPLRADELQPFSLARVADGAQAELRIGFDLGDASPASAAIAAEMIDDTLTAVRRELGASYGLTAHFVGGRLGARLEIAGKIDARRAGEACALIRDRLAALRVPGDALAARFALARRRVRAELADVALDPTWLADAAEAAAARGEPLHARRDRADAIGALTIDAMPPALARVDLSAAAIGIAGPRAAIDAGFAALSRTPVFVGPSR